MAQIKYDWMGFDTFGQAISYANKNKLDVVSLQKYGDSFRLIFKTLNSEPNVQVSDTTKTSKEPDAGKQTS